MNNGIIMLFLSEYKPDAKERIYTVEHGKDTFTGCQTNDAPVKCLLHHALDQGDRIKKIIFIMSKKVEKDGGGEKFKESMETYIQRDKRLREVYEIEMPCFESVEYNELELDTKKRTQKLYQGLSQRLAGQENARMYLDYTGGLRDIAFFMVVIMRYMEYHNITCKKIVYGNFLAESIQSIDVMYDMFHLINGVDQFVRTGNAKVLSECYERELDTNIKELLQKLIQFSNAISLCDIKNMDQILLEIRSGLENYERVKNSNSLLAEIFNDLIIIVRRKMYIQERKEFSYPQLIRWCLDNNMIQQALTLYIEKMPKYYYDNELLIMPEIEPGSLPQNGTKETYAFYTLLFTGGEESSFHEFLTALNGIDDTEKNVVMELQRTGNVLSKKARKAFNRMITFIHTYYNPYGRWREKYPEGEQHEIFPTMQKTVVKFIHDVKNNKSKQRWFFYGRKMEFKDTGTYEKRIQVLEQIQRGSYKVPESRIEHQKLYKMVKYYCALKIIRNRINHASEMEITEDENRAIKLLKEKHGICMDITFENVKSLMYDGIRAHE